jgi:hypothetical protein
LGTGPRATTVVVVAALLTTLLALPASAQSPPTANDDSYTTVEGSELEVDTAHGVLANDSDPDGDPLTATLQTDVTNGTLSLAADGSFSYTPDASFTGADAFTYQADDGQGGTAIATASLSVVPAITATITRPVAGQSYAPGYTGPMRAKFVFVPADPSQNFTLAILRNGAEVHSHLVAIDPASQTSPHVVLWSFRRLAPGTYTANVLDANQAEVATPVRFSVKRPAIRITKPCCGNTYAEGFNDPVQAAVKQAGSYQVRFNIGGPTLVFSLTATVTPFVTHLETAKLPSKLTPGGYTITARDQWGELLDTASFNIKALTVKGADLSASTIYSTVQDGYKDCTALVWVQSLPGMARVALKGRGTFPPHSYTAGRHSFKWCGASPGGVRLRPGTYRLRAQVTDKYGISRHSSWLPVIVATGWRIVKASQSQRGDQTIGAILYRKPCRFFTHVYTSYDAVIACGGGKGALVYDFTVPRTLIKGTFGFRLRVNDESGHIFTKSRLRDSHLYTLIGVDGHRIVEVLRATNHYTYKKRI